jgi:hypothetical protein
MTSPLITAPGSVLATGRALRIFLVTVAILVLAMAAFVLGRVSSGSGSVSPKAPAVSTRLPAPNDLGMCEQVGHLRSAGC